MEITRITIEGEEWITVEDARHLLAAPGRAPVSRRRVDQLVNGIPAQPATGRPAVPGCIRGRRLGGGAFVHLGDVERAAQRKTTTGPEPRREPRQKSKT